MTASETPVRKSVTVQASVDKAFRVFTEGVDTWWPRTHHIVQIADDHSGHYRRVNGRGTLATASRPTMHE